MDIFKVRTFYQVAKLGSLTLAAKQLNYSIPNVSRQIISLEEDLNISLFYRKGNKLTLTAQGKFLFYKAAELLSAIDSIKERLNGPQEKHEGLLRIYATEALASLWLVPQLNEFMDQYPDINLVIHGDDRAIDFTLRESDVVIGPRISKGSDLMETYLMTVKGGLYASQEYLEKFGVPRTIEDLDRHRLISRSGVEDLPCSLTDWLVTLGREKNNPRTLYLASNSLGTMAHFALEGKGIAYLSTHLKHPNQDKLIQVLPEVETPAIDIFYTYHRSLKNSKRIVSLQDYLLEKIAKKHA